MTSQLDSERMLMETMELLLEEKQTSLSVIRTGIFVLVAQIVVVCVMMVTSQFYQTLRVEHMILPFYILNVGLVCLAAYLIIHSLLRMRHNNTLILQMKKSNEWLKRLTD